MRQDAMACLLAIRTCSVMILQRLTPALGVNEDEIILKKVKTVDTLVSILAAFIVKYNASRKHCRR